MTSVNHDTAEIDPATEALTLQLIAQDLGQEVPQTLSEANPIPDHQEANSHWDDQSSDSQWDIQDPDIQCDDPNSDIEGNQTSKPLDNQSALPAEQKEVPESHSSSSDSRETITSSIEDHELEDMAKRTRENENPEPGGDAPGSDVPVHTDSYHSNDDPRPSGDTSNKRAKLDSTAAEDWNATFAWASPGSNDRSNSHSRGDRVAVPGNIDEDAPSYDHSTMTETPTDADYTTQAVPPATGTADWDEDDSGSEDFDGDSEDYEGDSEASEGDSEDSEGDIDDYEDDLNGLDGMNALSVHDDGDEEDSAESEDDGINPPSSSRGVSQPATLKPDIYKPKPTATLRPVTYQPNQPATLKSNASKANNDDRIPFIQIPWPGIPGWMESYVYENSGHGHGGRHGRRGLSVAYVLQNQRRMREEETVDIILEEHETVHWQAEQMIRKDEQARREAKGKGKAVD